MEKINLKKALKHLYQPFAKEVVQVDVPVMNFLMIDGEGDPNTSPAYADAVAALFTVSYTIKFLVKKGLLAIDYGVMPLEGLWWADDMSKFTTQDKSNWKWTMMIMQPSFVTPEIIDSAIAVNGQQNCRRENEKESSGTFQATSGSLFGRQVRANPTYRPVLRRRAND